MIDPRLEQVHEQESIGNAFPDRQQSVVSQHQEILVSRIRDQTRLFVLAQGNPFMVVLGQ